MAKSHVLEGTWDELALHAEELRRYNKRLRIEIIDDSLENIPSVKTGESLAEGLRGYIGAIHSGGAERQSENGGDRFTDYLVKKQKTGNL